MGGDDAANNSILKTALTAVARAELEAFTGELKAARRLPALHRVVGVLAADPRTLRHDRDRDGRDVLDTGEPPVRLGRQAAARSGAPHPRRRDECEDSHRRFRRRFLVALPQAHFASPSGRHLHRRRDARPHHLPRQDGAAHGGHGHGATFRVRLPAAASTPASRPNDDGEGRAVGLSLRGRTILVVDDDLSTLEVVTAVLNGAGARVVAAGSAAEGTRALEAGASPDAIVADLGMPGEDGFSFIAGVRRSDGVARAVPAVALSAYADPASQQAALDAGFTAFLAKPATPRDLLRAVDRLLPQTTSGV